MGWERTYSRIEDRLKVTSKCRRSATFRQGEGDGGATGCSQRYEGPQRLESRDHRSGGFSLRVFRKLREQKVRGYGYRKCRISQRKSSHFLYLDTKTN
jgi:hypothetical protein